MELNNRPCDALHKYKIQNLFSILIFYLNFLFQFSISIFYFNFLIHFSISIFYPVLLPNTYYCRKTRYGYSALDMAKQGSECYEIISEYPIEDSESEKEEDDFSSWMSKKGR